MSCSLSQLAVGQEPDKDKVCIRTTKHNFEYNIATGYIGLILLKA